MKKSISDILEAVVNKNALAESVDGIYELLDLVEDELQSGNFKKYNFKKERFGIYSGKRSYGIFEIKITYNESHNGGTFTFDVYSNLKGSYQNIFNDLLRSKYQIASILYSYKNASSLENTMSYIKPKFKNILNEIEVLEVLMQDTITSFVDVEDHIRKNLNKKF